MGDDGTRDLAPVSELFVQAYGARNEAPVITVTFDEVPHDLSIAQANKLMDNLGSALRGLRRGVRRKG